jgi:hypothetical protein
MGGGAGQAAVGSLLHQARRAEATDDVLAACADVPLATLPEMTVKSG